MNVGRGAALAAFVSLALVFELPLPTAFGAALLASPASAQGLTPAHPLARVYVREPVRRTPAPALVRSAVRAVKSTNIRPLAAYTVTAPPMLKPPFHIFIGSSAAPQGVGAVHTPGRMAGAGALLATPPPAISQCICGVCPPPPTQPPSALRRAVRPSLVGTTACPSPAPTPTPTPTASPTPGPVATPTPSTTPSSPPAVLGASGTGINPWWRYQEENVPGGGHVMVNVGTGNLLLQDDDMSVVHKGIALAFRRTYNSQSGHDVVGSDGGLPGLYGNGWTNTLDAHLVKSADKTVWSVYDIDGARYDYAHVPGSLVWTPPAGQHATLTYDGSCGVQWTKKSGTIYYFYRPDPTVTCPSLGVVGAYAGRLYQIIGRNTNIAITLAYTWDNPTAATGSNVTKITATTESGTAATLNFALVSGHNLLQSLVWPGGTTVSYGYDTAGDLTGVTLPPNNGTPPSFSDGVAPMQTYGYESSGTQHYLAWAASPRWATAPGGCSGDLKMGCGAYLLFRYAYGASATTTSLTELDHYGFMDPTPLDGTNTPIQPMPPGGSAVATAPALSEYYALGQLGATSTPTFRDSDGHATDWVVDATGRPGQTQECTATQNQQCIGTWLITSEQWDTNNNRVADIDTRGYETDYAYDTNGNTIAVAEPAPVAGASRPTSLYSYDAFNNVTASCSPNATHSDGLDWSGVPVGDTLCPANALATRLTWSNPASGPVSALSPTYEPFGQLLAITSPGTPAAPSGYTSNIAYSAGQQGGTDFGLPTSVTGEAFPQSDPSTPSRAPAQTNSYDANGNVVCYGNGTGTYAIQYDALNRRISEADPDDGSGACGNPLSPMRTAAYTAYYPDGTVRLTETPLQHAASVAAGTPGSAGHTFTYDFDGDHLTESFATPSGGGTTTFQEWYDGADRLVEVKRGLTSRYIYDLSQGGTVAVTSSAPFRAYGNLYARLVLAPGTTWTEQDATAFDALDRTVNTFRYSYNCTGCAALSATVDTYDDPSIGPGLLASTVDETGMKTAYTYDALGRTSAVAFSGDGGVTPARQYTYDANGNLISRSSSASGTEQYTYDGAGQVQQRIEGNAVSSPAIYAYSYYPDGSKAGVSVQSSALAASLAYSYRTDGKRASLAASWNGTSAALQWAYSSAGRELSQSDPWGSKAQTYALNGTLSSLTAPAGSFTSLQYDSEGNLAGMNAYGLTTTRTYDATNQLLRDDNGALTCGTGSLYTPTSASYTYLNGTQATADILTPNCSNNTVSGSTTTSTSDPRAGAVGLQNTPLAQPSVPPKFAGSCSNQPHPQRQTTYAYDAAGRMSGSKTVDTQYQSTGICIWNPITQTWTVALTYDAEGHELSYSDTASSGGVQFNETMRWGINGHPNRVAYAGKTLDLHWDGDDLLFASDQTGALEQFNVEQLLVNQVGSSAIITDRDMSGMRVSEHGAAGTDGLCKQSAYSMYGSGQTMPLKCGSVAGQLGTLVYDRSDGLDIGHGTVQGRRTYDTAMAQWTVPDAYKGQVEDPASQRPYMWAGNSPYEYSDPTGYECQNSSGTRIGANGESTIIAAIGCTTAKKVPPGKQLMPNGETVAQAINRQQVTVGAIIAAASLAAPGAEEADGAFLSFRAFKAVMGRAGPGYAWHHVVEQNSENLAKFGAAQIHSSRNVMRIAADAHKEVTRMYNSRGIRSAVNQLDFEGQFAEGMKVLQDLDVIPY